MNKEYYHNYYLKHKEQIKERSNKWRKENKQRFYELVYKSRKKKADTLKEQGIDYPWKSEKERSKLYEKRDKRINRSVEKEEI